jgi:hypothetical protein
MAPEPEASGNLEHIPFPAIIQATAPIVKITFLAACLDAQTGSVEVCSLP